jgi:hypothetical protein
MAEKPGGKPAGKTPQPEDTGGEPGQLGVDDRGNVTWEWKDEGDLLADDTLGTAERVGALVIAGLKIVDEDGPTARNPLQADGKRLKTGYNPYNSGALGKQAWTKKKNLQELSKWIELRKKMTEKKDGE